MTKKVGNITVDMEISYAEREKRSHPIDRGYSWAILTGNLNIL